MLPTESGGSFAHGRRPVGQVPDLAAFLQRGGSNSAVQASAPLAWSSGFLHTWSERGLESHESFSPALYMAIGCTASLGRAPDAVRFCGFPCCRPSAHAAAGASPLTHQAMYQSCVRGAPLRLQLRWQSSYWGRSYCHRGRTTRAVPLIPTKESLALKTVDLCLMQASLGIPSSLQTWWGPPQRSFSGPSSPPSPAELLSAANEGSTELAEGGSPSGGAQQQLLMQHSKMSQSSSSGTHCNLSPAAEAVVAGQRQGLLSGRNQLH